MALTVDQLADSMKHQESIWNTGPNICGPCELANNNFVDKTKEVLENPNYTTEVDEKSWEPLFFLK